ncbi:MAG: pyridoxamine 5'-phosphate oxidase family protein [Alphaproteobacteria bacterium]|nr:pyridoxamine 5'-phosphate oxidase family protein [Alphaproteobacteria bacterium]
MADTYEALTPPLKNFIAKQTIFFVATAAAGARVNISPKGLDSLRIPDDKTVVYLDLTGSGNETASHIHNDGRLTIMMCAFEGPPMILRLYGKGEVLSRESAEYREILKTHFNNAERLGARQMIRLRIESVATSCGYAVPHLEFRAERKVLDEWFERKGPEAIRKYWENNNLVSIDGLASGLEVPPVYEPVKG